jgi:glyoxylase-like metal-dependent hydrolase (beta-lactamase superfamily II)
MHPGDASWRLNDGVRGGCMAGRVVQIHDRIWQVQSPFIGGGMVMLYVVRGSKLALVDTGVASSPGEDLGPALKGLGLNMDDVNAILNTHGHHDHLGGNGNFKQEAPKAEVHLHSADKPFAESHEYHRTFMTEFLNHFGRSDLIAERQAVFAKTLSDRDVGVDRVLEDGDRVDLGGGVEFSVIHTPGHTPGSVCFYWEAEKLLLTGDAVQGRGSRGGGWPLYFNASDYRRSIARLRELSAETLALGHGFHSASHLNTPVRQGAEVQELLQESAEVTQAIDQAVRAQIAANPGASNLEIAQAATLDALTRIPTLLDPTLRIPGAQATLWAHIREARQTS